MSGRVNAYFRYAKARVLKPAILARACSSTCPTHARRLAEPVDSYESFTQPSLNAC
jgi:hypothetical protein